MLQLPLNSFIHCQNTLPSSFCDSVVESISEEEYSEHEFYDAISKTRYSNENELEICYSDIPEMPELHDYVTKSIQNYLNLLNVVWFSAVQGFSEIRFNKYREDKQMAIHCDHIRNIFDGNRKGVPILTILGLLNDSFEGGEFLISDSKISFNKGDVLIFPSNFMYPHCVFPVKSGVRYSFVCWAF